MGFADRRLQSSAKGMAAFDTGRLQRAAMACRARPVDASDMADARRAWAYFCAYGHGETGLVPSRAGGKTVEITDIGNLIAAILAAHKLGLAGTLETRDRLIRVTGALTELPLNSAGLPGNAYTVATLQPVAPRQGWSAPGVLRLAGALHYLPRHFPDFRAASSGLMKGWRLRKLVRGGRLVGGLADAAGHVVEHHQGRFGTEQAAARIADMLRLRSDKAGSFADTVSSAPGSDHQAPFDIRGPGPMDPLCISNPDPILWSALEFGWQKQALAMASALLSVARLRFEHTGLETSYGAYAIDRRPGLAISGPALAATRIEIRAPFGRALPGAIALATGTAFAWESLFPIPYARHLRDACDDAGRNDGYAPGIYETRARPINTATCATNAMVLVSLCHRAHGPLGGVG